MKISKRTVRDGRMLQPVSIELGALVERMRGEDPQNGCELPWLVFGATFGRNGTGDVRQMTGLLLMSTVSHDEHKISMWQQAVMLIPYTLTAFRSSNRRRLHVVARVGFADGHVAQSVEEYVAMLCRAKQQLVKVYKSLTDCELQPTEPTLTSACQMAFDPLVELHEEAQPFPVVMPPDNPLERYRHVRVDEDGSINSDIEAGERSRLRAEYYTCMHNAIERQGSDDDEAVLNTLAGYCRHAGIDEEYAVCRTLWHWRFRESEALVRKVFRAAYVKPCQGKPVSQMNQKERIARTISDFFSRRYQLRYNEVKQVTEFRHNDHGLSPWQPLGQRELRRIAFEEMMEGGHGWMIDIEMYVNSSLIRRYNPIHEFLSGVGPWDQKHNYIEDYACRLKTDYRRWPHFFHRWFLAMVAQAMGKSRDYGNSMVPMIIGTQAMKKSTFCKNILPYSLREYYMDDIKMDNAEQAERVLGRMWLVNIDEYNSKTEREQAKIKRLLTEKDVQIRRMRSDQYTMTPRLCSFIATTNDHQPLTDPTGSRRYLCVETTGQADMSGRVNYRQMYAQAVWEIDHGERYWFDNADEQEITEHNRQYHSLSTVDELLSTFFQPADRNARYLITTTGIQQKLRQHLMTSDVPTVAKLGRALKRLRYPMGAKDGMHGYYVQEIHR